MAKLYQIYDTVAASVIGGIISDLHDAPAIRKFTDALGSPDSILYKHPEDYNLQYLGEQQDNGYIEAVIPHTILTGKAWKEMNNGQA